MNRKFYTLDVFTDQVLTGNPLAVVLDSDGLSGDQMQVIAREFNLSETVFVSPPSEADLGAAVRIFTPSHELPFAGHPTVGTAILLNHLNHLGCGREFVLEEQVGPVRCEIQDSPNGKTARFSLPRLSSKLPWTFDPDRLAEAISLEESDLETELVGLWDAGVPYMIIPVGTLEAVQRAKADPLKLADIEPVINGIPANPYIFCRGGVEADAAFHARMFAASSGIAEDPATGSAVASLSGWIAKHALDESGNETYKIEQGYEMGRPSQIYLELTKKNGEVIDAGISGSAVIVSDGIIDV